MFLERLPSGPLSRYAENVTNADCQEKSFEAERQAMSAQETHLQQRIRTLLSARPSITASNSTRTVTDLQEELATLNVSHSTILAQLSTLSKEIHELRSTNATLVEENEGWEFLLRERTLNGKVREGGLLGARHEENSPGHLHTWDEQTEMDELHSELDAQSPIMDSPHESARDLDQDSLLSQPPRSANISASRDMSKASQGENLGDLPVTGAGLDLAAELGRAEVDLSGSEMRVLSKGDEGEGGSIMGVLSVLSEPYSSAAYRGQKPARGEQGFDALLLQGRLYLDFATSA